MNELIIADIEDFRSDSIEKGKCLICNRKITIVSPIEAFERFNRKKLLVEKGLISFDRNVTAFINYARDFEYEKWVIKNKSSH